MYIYPVVGLEIRHLLLQLNFHPLDLGLQKRASSYFALVSYALLSLQSELSAALV